MSQSNGLSADEKDKPLSQEEESALFDEVFNAVSKGEQVSDRKVDKAIEEARQHLESKKAVEAPVEQAAETTQEGVTAEVAEQTTGESAKEPIQEVVVKPEDHQAVLAEKAKWEQKAKSLDGREQARQRQIQELEQKLRRLEQQQQPAKPQDQKQASGKQDPRMEALRAADPDLAALLEEREAQIRAEAIREAERLINQHVEPIYKQQSEDYSSREFARLQEMIPNAREVIDSPHYAQWYDYQPKHIQDKANESAEGAAWVLGKYGYEMSLMYPQQNALQETKQEATPSDPKVAKLQEERNKRVQVGNVNQKVVAAPQQDSFDPNDYFEKTFASLTKKK